MKKGIGVDVLQASRHRINFVFDNFDKVYISFSGGKDSSVMLHLVMDEAIKRGRKIGLLFVDLEAQYKYTIDHIHDVINEYRDYLDVYWVCLPIALRNAVSVYEPKWKCWEDGKSWVRELPELGIHDLNYFDFFKDGMEFEDFVPKFGEWYSEGKKTACFVGIRTDESLNRYRTIASDKKKTFSGHKWTTKVYETNVYNVYPIYDWKTKDIWVYNNKFNRKYNKLYDIMHQAGLTIHQQRICQPYGDDQRKGLWLYHVIEPETWARVVSRVSGANSGAEFVQFNGSVSGQVKISKPENHTWKSFAMLILNSMPTEIREHYENKIDVFLSWWSNRGVWYDLDGKMHGIYNDCIPDELDCKLESSKKAPSWKRICKSLLRNDYWCKGLSFSQTNSEAYKKYKEYRKLKRRFIKCH